MRDCSEYDIMLSARMDGELSEDEERELDEHLAVCPDCRKYLRLLETVRDGLKEDLPAPPETLKQGVMYKIGLEKKRGRLVYGAFGKWTAIAAVICIVIFGAVKLKESGLQKSMAEAPAAAAEGYSLRGAAGGAENDAVQADGNENAQAEKSELEGFLTEEKHTAAVNTSMPMPAAAAPTAFGTPAEEEEPPAESRAEGAVPEAVSADRGDSVYSAGSLPGYDVGRAALGDGDYRSVCIFYAPMPESVDTEEWLTERPGEGELCRWLVSAEELRRLENEGGWNEFYYGDLTSGQGLVVLIAVEEE